MRILITPLICPMETAGPMQRSAALAKAFLGAGHEVAFCAGEDANYRPVEGVSNFPAPLPEPLGLPHPLGKIAVGFAMKTGLMGRRQINSFEQVLFLMGVLKPAYFFKDQQRLMDVIAEYKPDVVYSEFRLPAIIAAGLSKVRLVGGYSYPARPDFRSNPEFSAALRRDLEARGQGGIASILELFSRQEKSFVSSSQELEPFDNCNVCHVGPLFSLPEPSRDADRKKIVVYLGNSSIRPRRAAEALKKAFEDLDFQVYLAATDLPPGDHGNLHVAPRYNFGELLPEAVAFIHHGGQNSSVSGLLAGAAQLVFPCGVFERQYNADSIVRIGAGFRLENSEFTPEILRRLVDRLKKEASFRESALSSGNQLRGLGGAQKVVREVESL